MIKDLDLQKLNSTKNDIIKINTSTLNQTINFINPHYYVLNLIQGETTDTAVLPSLNPGDVVQVVGSGSSNTKIILIPSASSILTQNPQLKNYGDSFNFVILFSNSNRYPMIFDSEYSDIGIAGIPGFGYNIKCTAIKCDPALNDGAKIMINPALFLNF